MSNSDYDFIVVSNRLPVDSVVGEDGRQGWKQSPGGLVAALEPVMHRHEGAWIGWAGEADLELPPFDTAGMHLIPVHLSALEVEEYYEGFSNDTLWPLYHDVIAAPSFHRHWWESYRTVNERFAQVTANAAAKNAVVWVQDYQLQLVPKMLRELRPDLTIGFFDHIPFPPYGLFSQLPWRTKVIEGLLGADVVGFQRDADAGNFAQAVRKLKGYATSGSRIEVPLVDESEGTRVHAPIQRGKPSRTVIARKFPISIDADIYRAASVDPTIRARANQIRDDLGNPRTIILGVDRLDYTKGIRHRLEAYGELLSEGKINPEEVILVQVASPSRERVKSYIDLRDEIELTVGRINGEFSEIGHQAISYHHHSYPREEMVALYLSADIMLVTALRDGMNLVAKEYVASRFDDDGVLLLSEFAGASDELTRAVMVNPHDIDGMKEAIMRALEMPEQERRSRMRFLRKKVFDNDVEKWSNMFLEELLKHRHAGKDVAGDSTNTASNASESHGSDSDGTKANG